MPLAVAVDFGGTKILVSLVNEKYEIIDKDKIETKSGEDSFDIVERMNVCIKTLLSSNSLKSKDLLGIGIAIPGIMKGDKITLTNVNIFDFNLKKAVESEFDTKVIIENDVNAGLLGEYVLGSGKGFKNILGVYPGTGIGGGIIIHGKIYEGYGGAGEFGHMVVLPRGPLCGCGNRGCIESIASRSAIAKELVTLSLQGKSKTVYEMAKGNVEKVKSKVIYTAVKNNEKEVIRVIKNSAYYLGLAISNLVYCFNPELVVIGGGLIEKMKPEYYLDIIKETVTKNVKLSLKLPKIKEANLGAHSGVIGVSSLFFEDQ